MHDHTIQHIADGQITSYFFPLSNHYEDLSKGVQHCSHDVFSPMGALPRIFVVARIVFFLE